MADTVLAASARVVRIADDASRCPVGLHFAFPDEDYQLQQPASPLNRRRRYQMRGPTRAGSLHLQQYAGHRLMAVRGIVRIASGGPSSRVIGSSELKAA